MRDDFTVIPAGDTAVVVRFEERIDPGINARAMDLAAAMAAAALAGVRDVVPSFCAVTVHFDPVRTDAVALFERLASEARRAPGGSGVAARDVVEVPVCYGGELGPDLPAVASFAELTERQVVEVHAGVSYRVYMLGFAPGFAYLGEVDPRIAMPRRPTPRLRVPAGAVAVAGPQTGIYPFESPGGWNLIGRTPLRMFDAARRPPSLLAPGDRVEFRPVSREQFEHARAVNVERRP